MYGYQRAIYVSPSKFLLAETGDKGKGTGAANSSAPPTSGAAHVIITLVFQHIVNRDVFLLNINVIFLSKCTAGTLKCNLQWASLLFSRSSRVYSASVTKHTVINYTVRRTEAYLFVDYIDDAYVLRGTACDKQTRDAFQSSCLTAVRL